MGRTVVLAVDQSDSSAEAVSFCVQQLHQIGDEYHILHVVPRLESPSQFGMATIDILPDQDADSYETLLREATAFIRDRILPHLPEEGPDPILHLIKTEGTAESIGSAVCRKAGELDAAFVVLAGRQLGPLRRWVTASVTEYCVAHSPVAVVVHPK